MSHHVKALWDKLWFVNMGYTNKVWLIDWWLKAGDMLGLLCWTVCVILWRHLSQHDDVTSCSSPSQFFVTSGSEMFDRVSSWQAPVLTVWRGHHVTLWWSSTRVCQCNMWLWRHVHEHAALTSVQQMLKLWGPLPLQQSETIISSWSCAAGCCHGDQTQSVNNTSSKGSVRIPSNTFMGYTLYL